MSIQHKVIMFFAKYYFQKEKNLKKNGEIDLKRIRKNTSTDHTKINACKIVNFLVDDIKCQTIIPKNVNSKKIICYLHGGTFISGPFVDQYKMLANICTLSGSMAILIDYPMIPEYTYKETLATSTKVMDYLHARYGAENIVLMGDSAGGGLCLSTVLKLKNENKPLVSKLILIAPWLDVSISNPKAEELARTDMIINLEFSKKCGRLYAGADDIHDPLISPINGDFKGLPPTAVFIGTNDVTWLDAIDFKAKAIAKGVDLTYVEVPDMPHVYPAFPMPEARKAQKQIAEYILKT